MLQRSSQRKPKIESDLGAAVEHCEELAAICRHRQFRSIRVTASKPEGDKRHAGGCAWETQIGGSASARIGFYGVTPVVQPSGADQAAVTLGNVDGEIAGLIISNPPTRAEVQALRDACEELADDVRALSTLVHALRGALVAVGVVKGSA